MRGSTTLVSGPTGAGKTVMATQFAVDGATAGETVLFMAYEEAQDQVVANGLALGCDFEDPAADDGVGREDVAREGTGYERTGHEGTGHEGTGHEGAPGAVHIQSHHPEIASLDDHLVEFQELVERWRPTRVVLDGLSALERLGSGPSYRGFLLGVTTFARRTGITTFITATPPSTAGRASTAEHLTGLVDTVVVLRHREIGSTIHRGLHVQRMRGSHHDASVRELLVDGHSIRVGGPLPPAS